MMTEDQNVAVGVAVVLAFLGTLLGSVEVEAIAFALGIALTVDVSLGLTLAWRKRP